MTLNGQLLIQEVVRDRFYLELFCAKYQVRVEDLEISIETKNVQEVMYFFTDHLGGYNIQGICQSLFNEK